jgi:radical SAM superfamily enzyme YgiQ (UPF0313 family)
MINPNACVCFVVPPASGKYAIRDYAGGLGFESTQNKESSYVLPPLDLLQLAACIKTDFKVLLFDAQAEDVSEHEILGRVQYCNIDLAIVEISLPTLSADIEFGRQLSSLGIITIAKIYTHDISILEKILVETGFRLCLVAEVCDNLSDILLGKDVRGTAFCVDGAISINPKIGVVDLETLPFPERQLVKDQRYFYPKLGECTTILSSKGCPYTCAYYCPYPLVQGKQWRTKSVNYVIAEIKEALSLGHTRFLFRDPVFSLDKRRALDIASAISELDVKIEWWCETRADLLSRNLLQMMALSGCKGVNIGVESGDEELRFTKLKRGVADAVLLDISQWGKEFNISIAFLLMVGFPGETRKSIFATANLLALCRPQSIGINFPVPYWGTQMYKDAVENNWIISLDYNHFDGSKPVMQTEGLDCVEMQAAKEYLLKLFHSIAESKFSFEKQILGEIEIWSNS